MITPRPTPTPIPTVVPTFTPFPDCPASEFVEDVPVEAVLEYEDCAFALLVSATGTYIDVHQLMP
jgi:hypothetical protein